MSPADVKRVLGLLVAAWPREPLSDETAGLWRMALANVQHADAMAAAGRLIAESEFFPSMAKFHEAIGAARRAREHHEAMTRGLPRASANVPSSERFGQVMAGLRNQLRERGSRKHLHGGPDPCPVCDGRDAEWHKKAVTRDRYHDPKQCLTCRAKEST